MASTRLRVSEGSGKAPQIVATIWRSYLTTRPWNAVNKFWWAIHERCPRYPVLVGINYFEWVITHEIQYTYMCSDLVGFTTQLGSLHGPSKKVAPNSWAWVDMGVYHKRPAEHQRPVLCNHFLLSKSPSKFPTTPRDFKLDLVWTSI